MFFYSTRALFPRYLSASAATPTSSSTDQNQLSVVFSIADQPGLLLKALEPFSRSGINLTRIESRPSKPRRQVNGVKPTFDFFIDLQGSSEEPRVKTLLSELRQSCTNVSVVASKEVPWFPRHISDLDLISQNVLGAGAELESDHPGFHDKEYRMRRKQIAEAAVRYSYGQEIYRVPYSKEEVAAWGVVWDRLKPLLDKHACSEYTALLPVPFFNVQSVFNFLFFFSF
jgi:phenylalanine-4-hydroxylase